MKTIILLMCGSNKAFETAGYQYPKNLVDVCGKPMVEIVLSGIKGIDDAETHLVCLVPRSENRKYHTGRMLKLIREGAIVLDVNEKTGGALCTSLIASEHINPKDPLIIINGDILIDYPIKKAIEEFEAKELDGGMIVFNDFHPRWSFVSLDQNGLAVEIAEKRPISKLATAGLYYFREGADFLAAASQMLIKDAQHEGSFYLAPVYNELILAGKRVGTYLVPKNCYFTFKTPQDIQAYERHEEKRA